MPVRERQEVQDVLRPAINRGGSDGEWSSVGGGGDGNRPQRERMLAPLSPLGEITSRVMPGGHRLPWGETPFGIPLQGRLELKVADRSATTLPGDESVLTERSGGKPHQRMTHGARQDQISPVPLPARGQAAGQARGP
jgi:hypothetical protein